MLCYKVMLGLLNVVVAIVGTLVDHVMYQILCARYLPKVTQ